MRRLFFPFDGGVGVDGPEAIVESLERLLVVGLALGLLFVLLHADDGSQQIMLPLQPKSVLKYSALEM